MPYVPWGVECKTPECHTAIILGDVWEYDRPLQAGDRIEFVVLRPRTLKCQACQREHEYTQVDARKFPEVPPRNE